MHHRFINLQGYCKAKVTCPGCGHRLKLSADLAESPIDATLTEVCVCGTVIHWQPVTGFAEVTTQIPQEVPVGGLIR